MRRRLEHTLCEDHGLGGRDAKEAAISYRWGTPGAEESQGTHLVADQWTEGFVINDGMWFTIFVVEVNECGAWVAHDQHDHLLQPRRPLADRTQRGLAPFYIEEFFLERGRSPARRRGQPVKISPLCRTPRAFQPSSRSPDGR